MKDTRRVIIMMQTTKKPNPYEVWVLAALFLSSTASMLNIVPSPSTIRASLPGPSQFFWNLQLVIGSFLALFGMWLIRTKLHIPMLGNQAALARMIKIAGHLWTGSGALIYACVLFYYAGVQATMPGFIMGSIAIAAAFRAMQLRGQVRHMLQKVGEQDELRQQHSFVDGGE